MEDNKLIAEFMEHIINYGFKKDAILYIPQGKGNASNNSVHLKLDKVKYHTSWDWLMPVVEKIEDLKYRVEISQNGCLIESHKDLDTARMNSGIGEIEPTKLKATYKAVVEFIKEYNQNN